MDDRKHSKIKRINSKDELDKITDEFHKIWENRKKLKFRHKLKAREIIRDNGKVIKHKKFVRELQKEFGYDEKTVNIIISQLVYDETIYQKEFDNEFDIRYYI